jgi:UDP-N-acetylglucosamine transferase subunit ALG13
MGTFVTLGNLRKPFPRILTAVAQAVEQLSTPILIQHGHTPWPAAMPGHTTGVAFLDNDEFEHAVAASDVCIAHGGAGSILTAHRAGVIPFVMPRRQRPGEHIDDHQHELVSQLAGRGLVHRFDDAAQLRKLLREHTPAPSESLSAGAAISTGTPRAIPQERSAMVQTISDLLATIEEETDGPETG